MQNKYAKICAKCNTMVQAYAGVCERSGGRWEVKHVDCHTPPTITSSKPEEDLSKHPAFRDEEDEPLFAWMDHDLENSLF